MQPMLAKPPPVKESSPPLAIVAPSVETLARPAIRWQTVLHHGVNASQLLRLSILAVVAGLSIWFLQRDSVALVFLALALLVLVLHHRKKSELTDVVANDAGVTIRDKTFHHKDTKSFWIEYNPEGLKELSLELTRWYSPYVKIPLGEQDPTELHAFLSAHLPEEEHRISLIDVMVKHQPRR
jgi:hypothetical protein